MKPEEASRAWKARTSLGDALLVHYQSTGSRDVAEVAPRVAHLDGFFRGRRADQITSKLIADYIVHRQNQETVSPVLKLRKKPANSTVNREVAILMRALKLAVEQNHLVRVPIVHKPAESAPRKGFFEPAAFEAVKAHLPLDLQVAVTLAYDLGWRILSEVLTLLLRQIDLDRGCIVLDPGSTKNRDGRVVYLRPAVVEMLGAHIARVHELERETKKVIPYLFTIFPTPYVAKRLIGTQRQDFRKAWATACEAAGHPEALAMTSGEPRSARC